MRLRDTKKGGKDIERIEKQDISKQYIPGKFLARGFALVMDMFMIILPINLLVGYMFGMESLQNPESSPIAGIVQISLLSLTTIIFWKVAGQTPGKKAFSLQVVDSGSFKLASIWKLILRYLGYFISMITLVGFFIPLFRKDKKALHDLISGTTVIHKIEN